jgi:hypothetical protein
MASITSVTSRFLNVCLFGAAGLVWLGLGGLGIGSVAHAEDPISFNMTIKDHKFTPAEIHVAAGKAAVINLKNEDPTAEEFDSDALGIEKVIPGGRSGIVRLRPLEKGSYPFVGEYFQDTAKGVIIVD